MAYTKPQTLDATPSGDTVKTAIVSKLDVNAAQIVSDLNTHEALTETHGATGAVVGTTNTQTLTNKTLTAPTITGAGAIAGTFTGNVTGDLTGDVTGDVTGNVTGNLTGNVTGNVTGNLTGNVTGNVTGDVTGDLTGNADTATSVTVGSDADGDMYYRASSTLARLAKSTANFKLFMNAGATGPEWAAGIKIGTFTRAMDAATGDVAYTGVGFKPSHIIFLTMLTDKSWSIGFDSSAAKYVIFMIGATNYSSASTASIYLIEDGTSKNQTAIVKTLGADGFTLTWTRTGATASATGYIYYMAFR
jgi:hypothetical protein